MRSLALAAFLLAAGAVPAAAQQPVDPTQLELVRTAAAAERKALVAANLGLDDAEAEQFWPVYNEYRAKVAEIDARLTDLIGRYAAHYEAMDDETARALLEGSQEVNEDRIELRGKYRKRFEKAIGIQKLARFYQIESKLDAIVNFKLAEQIPLIEPGPSAR